MKYLLKSSQLCFGLSRNELRRLALEFAKTIKVAYPESWNENMMASRGWYEGFMKRHANLSLRTPEKISANRAKAFSKENVEAFFANLKSLHDETPFTPDRIWNMDESGFPTVPNKVGKVIAEKGSKRVGQMASQERGTNVTMALAVNAMGNSIPPVFLFPRKIMRDYFMDNAPLLSIGFANSSGWMQKEEFIKYMHHFIKHSHAKKGTHTLLLLDNHISHFSIEAIDLAINHDISMLTFPPHCSHKMQPLDVSVFGPLKKMFASVCTDWMKSNIGRTIDIQHIPSLVGKAMGKCITSSTIMSGFAATGIFPLDSNIFTETDFILAEISGENECATENETNHADIHQDERREIFVLDDIPGNEIEVSTSAEPSTSGVTAPSSLNESLNEVGPLRYGLQKKKSNRGRKPMHTSILTSADTRMTLNASAEKSAQNKRKKQTASKQNPPKKRRRSSSSPSESDFCTICLGPMPKKLTKNNSIDCMECKRPVHLKCANMTRSYYICKHCESEESD